MKVSLYTFCAVAALTLSVARAEEAVSLAPKFEPFANPPITLVSDEEAAPGGCCDNGCCNNGSCCGDSCCGSCCGYSRHVGRDFLVCRDRCPGVIGGVDLLFLRPYSSGRLTDLGNNAAQLNLEPCYRAWIGWQNCDGLGGRLRYFEFDRGDVVTTGQGTAAVSNQLGVEFRTIDAELTQAVDFRRWNFLFAGGLRYAETSYDVTTRVGNALVGGGSTSLGFDGMGLTTAAQATRDLNRSGTLRMTMGGRWSAVYGQGKIGASSAGPFTQVNDELINILELNVGPQWRRCIGNGAYLTVGLGLEAQYWSNAFPYTTGITADGVGTDFGFFGLGTSVAITR